MPTTKQSIPIGIKAPSLNDGEWVKVTNLKSGGTLRGQIKSGECILNPANSNLTWNDKDTLSVESNGRILESSAATISKGGAQIKFTSSTADDSPAVNL